MHCCGNRVWKISEECDLCCFMVMYTNRLFTLWQLVNHRVVEVGIWWCRLLLMGLVVVSLVMSKASRWLKMVKNFISILVNNSEVMVRTNGSQRRHTWTIVWSSPIAPRSWTKLLGGFVKCGFGCSRKKPGIVIGILKSLRWRIVLVEIRSIGGGMLWIKPKQMQNVTCWCAKHFDKCPVNCFGFSFPLEIDAKIVTPRRFSLSHSLCLYPSRRELKRIFGRRQQ